MGEYRKTEYETTLASTNYYSGIYFAPKEPFSTENASLFDVNANIKEDKSTSIYYDMVNPWALFL